MPAAFVIALVLGAISDCTSIPPLKDVSVLLKWICASEGARKPVLTDPRILKLSAAFNRVASFPVITDPKSE